MRQVYVCTPGRGCRERALTGLAHGFSSPQEIWAKAGWGFALPVQRVSCTERHREGEGEGWKWGSLLVLLPWQSTQICVTHCCHMPHSSPVLVRHLYHMLWAFSSRREERLLFQNFSKNPSTDQFTIFFSLFLSLFLPLFFLFFFFSPFFSLSLASSLFFSFLFSSLFSFLPFFLQDVLVMGQNCSLSPVPISWQWCW